MAAAIIAQHDEGKDHPVRRFKGGAGSGGLPVDGGSQELRALRRILRAPKIKEAAAARRERPGGG